MYFLRIILYYSHLENLNSKKNLYYYLALDELIRLLLVVVILDDENLPSYISNFTCIVNSVSAGFCNGWLSFAIAINSFTSLYKPTLVM